MLQYFQRLVRFRSGYIHMKWLEQRLETIYLFIFSSLLFLQCTLVYLLPPEDSCTPELSTLLSTLFLCFTLLYLWTETFKMIELFGISMAHRDTV